jgi:hypothetical protein
MSAHLNTPSRRGRGKSTIPPVAASAVSATTGLIAEVASRIATERPVDPEARRLMIAEAAYYRAEQRGFEPGHELEDWLDAEARIDLLTGR